MFRDEEDKPIYDDYKLQSIIRDSAAITNLESRIKLLEDNAFSDRAKIMKLENAMQLVMEHMAYSKKK